MMSIDTLEWALRGSALTSLVLLMFLLLRTFPQARLQAQTSTSVALLAVLGSLGAYLLCSASQQWCSRTSLAWPLAAMALLFPFAIWHLVQTALLDQPSISHWAWLGAAGLLLAGTGANLSALDLNFRVIAFHGVKVLALAFLSHALWRLWRFADDDVVETRRSLRRFLLAGALMYALVVVAVELSLQGRRAQPWLEVLNVSLIATLLACGLFLLMQLRSEVLCALMGWQAEASISGLPMHLQSEAHETRSEAVLLPHQSPSMEYSRLEQLMREQRIYHEPQLDLAQLALRMQLPQYQLRRLIHQEFGHRNWASFVNHYRLDEVALRLSNPSLDRRPILTLALEAGFGSIGPFNRSFRERFGLTPSEYRAKRGVT